MNRTFKNRVGKQTHRDPGHSSYLSHHNILEFPLGKLYVGDHVETSATMGKKEHIYSHIVYGGICQSNELACFKIHRLTREPHIRAKNSRPDGTINNGWTCLGWMRVNGESWSEVFQRNGESNVWYGAQNMKSIQAIDARVHLWVDAYADHKYADNTGGRQKRIKDIKQQLKTSLSDQHEERIPPPIQPEMPHPSPPPSQSELSDVEVKSEDSDEPSMPEAQLETRERLPERADLQVRERAGTLKREKHRSPKVFRWPLSLNRPAHLTPASDRIEAWSNDSKATLRKQTSYSGSIPNNIGPGTLKRRRESSVEIVESRSTPRIESQHTASRRSMSSQFSRPGNERGRYGDMTPGISRESAIPLDSDAETGEGNNCYEDENHDSHTYGRESDHEKPAQEIHEPMKVLQQESEDEDDEIVDE